VLLHKISPVVVALLVVGAAARGQAPADELWVLHDGRVTISLDEHDLAHLGLTVEAAGKPHQQKLTLSIDAATDVAAYLSTDAVVAIQADYIGLVDGLRFRGSSGEALVVGILLDEAALGLHADAGRALATVGDDAVLIMRNLRVNVNRRTNEMTLPGMSIDISAGLAEALGDASLAGESIGYAVLEGTAARVGGGGSEPVDRAPQTPQAVGAEMSEAGTVAGPNMTFCQLYDLRQFGRSGSILGLALATTSWNVGTADLMWFSIPDTRHPFIVQNLYRLDSDRLKQIGQSWIKHGFFALGSEQCGTACTYEPGHGTGDWLGVGCTDTYSASLNASQSGLGPRYEVNPWTGSWRYNGSHFQQGGGHDGQIDHRLQVDENDLLIDQRPGARFFAEGYYVVSDDVEHMNSASWKEVYPSGAAGGTWTFGMSDASIRPTDGFVIDVWSGARQTVLAQEVPPVEFVSPDGRCVLAAKTTDLGGGTWHYEYALLNVDMDRGVKSFSVPVALGATVTNISFSAVRSHDEPFSNTPWTSAVAGGAITWITSDNPLRWGTVYNFWFDVDREPVDSTVTIGHYEPGTPESVSGVTTGPSQVEPECLAAAPPVADATGIAKSRYLSIVPGNPGSATAIRVRLTSLLHPPDPGQVAALVQPDFTAFEGQVRWVGPPGEYSEGTAAGDTFMAAALQCDPYFRDWGTVGLLHVYGAEIVPHSTYDAQEIHVNCQASLEVEAAYSTPLPVNSAYWGDVVEPFAGDPGVTAPVDFRDVAALVEKFVGSLDPIKARAQQTPNLPDPSVPVDFRDISAVVAAFVDGVYPYSGPVSCP